MAASTAAIERQIADGQSGQMTGEEVKKINPIRAVTPEAVRLAKTLIRHARFGALAVEDPVTGRPNISRVAVAPDMTGAPVSLISSLSAHTKALLSNPHCAVLLGEPGKGDPLAHPRVSVSCKAEFLDRGAPGTDSIAARYLRCNPKAKLYASFADFTYVRLAPLSASLNGGFGQAYNLTGDELLSPGFAVPTDRFSEAETMNRLNGPDHRAVKDIAAAQAGKSVLKWAVVNFDAEGIDVAAGKTLYRIWFSAAVSTQDNLFAALVNAVSAS
jgi:heme iron utilization protein